MSFMDRPFGSEKSKKHKKKKSHLKIQGPTRKLLEQKADQCVLVEN